MTSTQLKAFLDAIREAETNLNISVIEESETNQQTQDILHAVEFDQCNPRKSASLVNTLRTVRKKRRIAKDEIARLTPIVEWSKNNQNAIKSLERLLGDLRKTEHYQEERVYWHRTDILESENLLKKEKTDETD